MSKMVNLENLKTMESYNDFLSILQRHDDRPSVLYKYRKWDKENNKDLLRTGMIVFSRPDSFEDLFDCHLPEIYPRGIELLNYYLKDSSEKNKHFTERQHFKYAMYWCLHSPMRDSSQTNLIDEYFWTRFNEEHGILCLCKTADINEMWEKYANQSKGYCVGFDAQKLSSQFFGHEVIYCPGIPTIDFVKDPDDLKIIKEIFYKSNWWAFEKEYRYFKRGHGTMLTDEDRLVDIANFIREVHLGKNMSLEDRNEIKEIVAKKYYGVDIIE